MQSEGVGLKCLIFSEVTLIVRSPFVLPSPCLRDGFEVAPSCFWQGFYRNKLIVNELYFLNKREVGVGNFCIICYKNAKISKFGN